MLAASTIATLVAKNHVNGHRGLDTGDPAKNLLHHAAPLRFQRPKKFIGLLHCSMSEINGVEPTCCAARPISTVEGRKSMRAALYLRVSTTDQTTENQERELRAAADRLGHVIVEVYRDHGISGGKGRGKRPAFDKLHRDATLRKFDLVMAWSVDRLGRSLQGPGPFSRSPSVHAG